MIYCLTLCLTALHRKCKWLLMRRPVERAVWGGCWEKAACPGSVTALLVPCLEDSLWHQLSTAGTGPDTKPGWQLRTLSALLRTPPTSVTAKLNCPGSPEKNKKQNSLVMTEFWMNDTGLGCCFLLSLWLTNGKSWCTTRAKWKLRDNDGETETVPVSPHILLTVHLRDAPPFIDLSALWYDHRNAKDRSWVFVLYWSSDWWILVFLVSFPNPTGDGQKSIIHAFQLLFKSV